MGEQNAYKLLVVDDEPDISNLVVYNAVQAGYNAEAVFSGEDAISKARESSPDLIILDLMLPGINGLDVCRVLKGDKQTANIPILMLTAKGTEKDIVKGLELGADDYVTKPFSPQVLMARIKSILRRSKSKAPEYNKKIIFKDIALDPVKREITIGGKPVELTFTEFEILHFMLQHPGWVFTRNEIVNNIRGDNYYVTERSVDVQIVGLRKKLGQTEYIETVRGVGYRLKEK